MPTHSSEGGSGFDDPIRESAGYHSDGRDGRDGRDERDPHLDHDYVDRVETLIRLLYTLLFFLVIRVLEAAIGVIVFFQLAFALITNRTPNPAVNAFARRVIEYGYQIAHYVTYNRDRPPFPFDELPPEQADDRGELLP